MSMYHKPNCLPHAELLKLLCERKNYSLMTGVRSQMKYNWPSGGSYIQYVTHRVKMNENLESKMRIEQIWSWFKSKAIYRNLPLNWLEKNITNRRHCVNIAIDYDWWWLSNNTTDGGDWVVYPEKVTNNFYIGLRCLQLLFFHYVWAYLHEV